jgi:hypothetical protein
LQQAKAIRNYTVKPICVLARTQYLERTAPRTTGRGGDLGSAAEPSFGSDVGKRFAGAPERLNDEPSKGGLHAG